MEEGWATAPLFPCTALSLSLSLSLSHSLTLSLSLSLLSLSLSVSLSLARALSLSRSLCLSVKADMVCQNKRIRLHHLTCSKCVLLGFNSTEGFPRGQRTLSPLNPVASCRALLLHRQLVLGYCPHSLLLPQVRLLTATEGLALFL